jgi:hypothetical protein
MLVAQVTPSGHSTRILTELIVLGQIALLQRRHPLFTQDMVVSFIKTRGNGILKFIQHMNLQLKEVITQNIFSFEYFF